MVTRSGPGEGSKKGMPVLSRSRNPGQPHRTPISHSGNSPQATTICRNKLHQPPETEPEGGTTDFQAEVVQSTMPPLPHHHEDTLSPSPLPHWDTKYFLAPLSVSQQDWWWKSAFMKWMAVPWGVPFCFRSAATQRGQSRHSLCSLHWVTGSQWSPLQQHQGYQNDWSRWGDPAQTPMYRCFNAVIALH